MFEDRDLDEFLAQFPPRADLLDPPRWCDRCRCVHAGIAREDVAAILKASGLKPAERIDDGVVAAMLRAHRAASVKDP